MNGTVMHVDLLQVLWTTPSRKQTQWNHIDLIQVGLRNINKHRPTGLAGETCKNCPFNLNYGRFSNYFHQNGVLQNIDISTLFKTCGLRPIVGSVQNRPKSFSSIMLGSRCQAVCYANKKKPKNTQPKKTLKAYWVMTVHINGRTKVLTNEWQNRSDEKNSTVSIRRSANSYL